MDRSQLKLLAKQQIKGNVWMYFLASIIVSAIVGAIPALFSVIGKSGEEVSVISGSASGLIPMFVTPIFAMGMVYLQLDIRSGKGVKLERLFDPFRDFIRCWLVNFLMELFVGLWMLLFIIPGIVKAYSYSMAPYIVAENPEISANDAITASRKMMKGHKGELFMLDLSFIGWALLGILTLGIVYIYVSPYQALSHVNFYDRIKGEAAPKQPTMEGPEIP